MIGQCHDRLSKSLSRKRRVLMISASGERRKERIARDSSHKRERENASRRLRGRNSHYRMDGRAQEVEIRKRVNWAIPGGTPPGAYARRAWLVNIHIFIPFLLLISSCPVIERNSLMRYKRKRPAARRSSITGAARRGADQLKSIYSLLTRSLVRSFARSLSRPLDQSRRGW